MFFLSYYAGVHSGDATLVLPAQLLYVETSKRVKKITKKIAQALNITGPFNIQYLCRDNHIKVIECNLRASRSFPFVSKTFNVNFIDLATRAMVEELCENSPSYDAEFFRNLARPATFNLYEMDYVCVKSPMFSFTRLEGADPVLRVEMTSTGEVACFGDNKHEALLKALMSSGLKLPVPDPRLAQDTDELRLDYIEYDAGYAESPYASKESTPVFSKAFHKPSPVLQTPGKHKDSPFREPRKSTPILKPRSINAMVPSPGDSPLIIALSRDSVGKENEKEEEKDDEKMEKLLTIPAPPAGKEIKVKESTKRRKEVTPWESRTYRCNILVSIGPLAMKRKFLESAELLDRMGFRVFATVGTHQFLKENKVKSVLVPKPSSSLSPNALELISEGKIHLVINIPSDLTRTENTDGYKIRRKAVDFHVPLFSNLKLARTCVKALAKKYVKSFEYLKDSQFFHIKSWRDYMNLGHRLG